MEELVGSFLKAGNDLVRVKKLLIDLERELNTADRPATKNFSAAIYRISDFLGRAGAGPEIRIHFTHLGAALLDVSQGRRTPLFDVPVKTGGRPHDSTMIWKLRGRAVECLWLMERREGSDRAAVALMVQKCPQLHALKRDPRNDIHKVIINWRAQLRDNVGNKYVASVLKSAIAKFEQQALTPARALELGLSRLQALGRMIDRLPLGSSAKSSVMKTSHKGSAI